MAKRRRLQQLLVQTRSLSAGLLAAVDVVAGYVRFRADRPGELEMRGYLALRGNQHHDETLRCGRRKNILRCDHNPSRAGGFQQYVWILRDAANRVHVGVVKLNLRVKVGW